ncbi:MAG: hypothetical protein H0T85_11100, partial [Geodermatophilaceae bacterium]|nr:hypothetical protein [Geodermatophilaceae bacterium]
MLAVLLPVLLMLARAVAEIVSDDDGNQLRTVLVFLGTPTIALIAG